MVTCDSMYDCLDWALYDTIMGYEGVFGSALQVHRLWVDTTPLMHMRDASCCTNF